MENFGRIAVNTNDSWAVAQNLSTYTVAFVDLNKPRERMTSGVLVSIGGHLFVATVGQAVPSQPEDGLLFVVPKTKAIDAETLPILRCGKSKSEWPDVGFLELDPAGALPVLRKEVIDLDHISVRGPGHPECRCLLFGYSSEMIRAERTDPSQLQVTFRPMCYSNAPIKPENWPNVSSADPRSDETVDILLPYDPEKEMWYYEENEGDDKSTGTPWGHWRRAVAGLFDQSRTLECRGSPTDRDSEQVERKGEVCAWLADYPLAASVAQTLQRFETGFGGSLSGIGLNGIFTRIDWLLAAYYTDEEPE